MKTSFPRCAATIFPFVLLICSFTTAKAATNKKPILISQTATTRAVAFESFTMKAEPFPLTATVPLSADTQIGRAHV